MSVEKCAALLMTARFYLVGDACGPTAVRNGSSQRLTNGYSGTGYYLETFCYWLLLGNLRLSS